MALGSTMRVTIGALLVMAISCGGDGSPSGDGGPEDGDALCTTSGDCDDGVFCNGTEQCDPDAEGADPLGCVAGAPPCERPSLCNEEMGECADCRTPDADGDGHEAVACGGDDCDDSDPSRFPGNTETCDADAHDEDCDPETFGDVDEDGDGFVDAACCNGTTCAMDCDDDDPAVNPSEIESCNGVDDDCSGAIDDAADLCPGGTCGGGRCTFSAWQRSFGSSAGEGVSRVTIGDSGNVYVSGLLGGPATFGGSSPMGAENALYVVKYSASGGFQWVYTSSATTCGFRALDHSVSSDGRVMVVGATTCEVDFGGTASSGGFVLQLDGDGSFSGEQWLCDGQPDDCWIQPERVTETPSGWVMAGYFWGSHDLGFGAESSTSRSMVVLSMDPAGELTRESVIARGESVSLGVRGIDANGAGDVVVAGRYSDAAVTAAGEELPAPAGPANGIVVALDAGLTPSWATSLHSMTSSSYASIRGIAYSGTGAISVGGEYGGTVDLGDSDPSTVDAREGLLLTLDTDGSYVRLRNFDRAVVRSVESNDAGRVYAAGEQYGDTDFGGGTVSVAADVDKRGFLAEYDDTGALNALSSYGTGAAITQVESVDVGPGNSVAVSGFYHGSIELGDFTFESEGESDVFVVRLGM